MRVDKHRFLHIHRVNEQCMPLSLGDSLAFVKGTRNFFVRAYDRMRCAVNLPPTNEAISICRALQTFSELPDEQQKLYCCDYVKKAHGVLKEQSMFIREVIFEEVRNADFPEHPSRFSCAWLLEEHTVEWWWDTLHDTNTQLLEVEATGVIHLADQGYLQADFLPHDELRRRARDYWTGATGKNPIEQEVLFEGTFQVTRVFENIGEYRHARATQV